MKQSDIRKAIDKLVELDVQVKALEKERDELKKSIVALGEGTHAGKAGAVTVSLQSRKTFKAEKAKVFMTDTQFESCYVETKSIVTRITAFGATNQEK